MLLTPRRASSHAAVCRQARASWLPMCGGMPDGGSAPPEHSACTQEIFAAAELQAKFSLERITKSAAVFDKTKLAWMNGQYLRALPDGEVRQAPAPEKGHPASPARGKVKAGRLQLSARKRSLLCPHSRRLRCWATASGWYCIGPCPQLSPCAIALQLARERLPKSAAAAARWRPCWRRCGRSRACWRGASLHSWQPPRSC